MKKAEAVDRAVKRTRLIITMTTSMLLGPVQADSFALSTKAGALGYGLESTTNLFSNINARFGYNAYRYEENNIAGNSLDVSMKLQLATLLLDLYPTDSAFRLSAGIAFNSNQTDPRKESEAELSTATNSVYSRLSLDENSELIPISPYRGVGWSNSFADNKGWGFNIDLGVMLQSEADLDSNTSDTPSGLTSHTALKQGNDTEDELKRFDLLPIVSFGISYTF